MSFDTLVTNPGRLRILTALAVEESQDFVGLRKKTQLTDGNLSSHARRLREAGLVTVEKTFRNGKPVTNFTLTLQGRQALESHVRKLLAAISQRRVSTSSTLTAEGTSVAELPAVAEPATISRGMDALAVTRQALRPMVRVALHESEVEDDLPPDEASAIRSPRVVRTVVRNGSRPVMMEVPAVQSSRTQPQEDHPTGDLSGNHHTAEIHSAIAHPHGTLHLNGSSHSSSDVVPLATTSVARSSALAASPEPAASPAQPEEPADWID